MASSDFTDLVDRVAALEGVNDNFPTGRDLAQLQNAWMMPGQALGTTSDTAAAGDDARFGQLAGRLVRYGRSTVHYNGTNVSDVATIPHGLGATPLVVLITGEDSGGAVTAYVVGVTDATNFTCWGRDVTAAGRGPGDLVINWLAIA